MYLLVLAVSQLIAASGQLAQETTDKEHGDNIGFQNVESTQLDLKVFTDMYGVIMQGLWLFLKNI